MSFLPEIEHGALKKRNAVLKRPARGKKKTGYLTKGQRRKDGKELWREYHKMTDWILRL
jgi:hypothetical protein